jgi:hypothetical protein
MEQLALNVYEIVKEEFKEEPAKEDIFDLVLSFFDCVPKEITVKSGV